ncbi:putative mannosyltransferase KTR3-like protein [Cladobotryum mycophilum]|uniref:Mannosyltransferase KTR3-like protein n=1 Tax=Cladobotryum mycophilum TaxID=491253 RepID=A0ABR0SWS2_9HYPO
MASIRTKRHSSRWAQPAAWAWAIFFLQLTSFVHGLAIPSPAADQRPRAALISLAHEHDLQALLSTIHQLEGAFNHRYHYDWVIFSTKPLSDEFRSLTSNATSGSCIYEVITEGNWIVPRPTESSQFDRLSFRDDRSTSLLGQLRQWNSGPFARENRLRDYDWFWRIEPGAQFLRDIDFDVFRFMRDQGIAYGFNEALFDKEDMRVLVQQVKSFIEKHPDLLHVDADVSWLLASDPSAEAAFTEQDGLEEDFAARSKVKDMIEGSPSHLCHLKANWVQEETETETERDVFSPSEAFASWLSTIYKTGLNGISPTFDIGSLAFFRSQSHQVLINHLDMMGELYYRGPRDHVPPSEECVELSSQGHSACKPPKPPEYTPDPELSSSSSNSKDPVAFVGKTKMEPALPASILEHYRNPDASMDELFKQWELMAQDLGRQDAIPGLRSGNTVIDERNFSLI